MKVKVSLDITINESKSEELMFEREGENDMINVYWRGTYIGAVSLDELEDFLNALADVFLLSTTKKKSEK